MKLEDAEKGIEFLRNLTNDCLAQQNQLKFLTRILKQIILTNGGEVNVDIYLGEDAQKETRQIYIGTGKVWLE